MVYPPPSNKPFIPQPMERVEPELGVLATPPSQDGETGGVSGVQRGEERRTEPDDPESRVVRELCGSDGEGRVRGAGDKERGDGQPEEQERAGRGLLAGAEGDRLEPNDPELGLRGPSSDGEGDVSDIWRPWESKERRPSIQDVIALADLPDSRKVALSNPGHYTKSGHLISMNEPNDQELRLSDNVFSSQRP